MRAARMVGYLLGAVFRWWWNHLWWVVLSALAGLAARVQADSPGVGIASGLWVALVPALADALWAKGWPASYERWVQGPALRRSWRRWVKRAWPAFTVRAGIATEETVETRSLWNGETRQERVRRGARLTLVETDGSLLRVTARTGLGQTSDDLERVAPALRDAAGAQSVRVEHAGPGRVCYELVMRDHLAGVFAGVVPDEPVVGEVVAGLCENGAPWRLILSERHTLIAGCSGSGKGSVFWGVAGGLAPAVHAGLVRLFGIDLKFGLEVATGADLFSLRADNEKAAVKVLERAHQVMEDRGDRMAGAARKHTPSTSEPLVVVMIDELATLTAYMQDRELKKEAARLLSGLLTKGRALGVIVVAALQDPRKETVPQRGLFTQTVALRLRSREEVTMVLGEGMADTAPAHRISPSTPGVGYVVDEVGTATRVRAGYWSDHQIKMTARRYPTPHVETLPADPVEDVTETPVGETQPVSAPTQVLLEKDTPVAPSSGRKRRAARKPRAPRSPRGARQQGQASQQGRADRAIEPSTGMVIRPSGDGEAS